MPEQTLGGIPLGLGMVMKINFLNFHASIYTHTCTHTQIDLGKASLVPRPHPLFNVARRKGEGLVREVTCMIFMWKGGGRVIILRGLVICLRAPCT